MENTEKFRPLRRAAQALEAEECEQILASQPTGILAVTGDGGYPYAVPVNHIYSGGRIYFHCAKEGHKIDAIRADDRVSFCVIAKDDVVPEKQTTAYISVIVFGRARIIEDDEELRRVALEIGRKFAADYPAECEKETEDYIAKSKLCCVEIVPEHISGKAGREIIKERQKAKQ